MRRFPFDTILVAINPADRRYRPFIPTVVAEARTRKMGVIGMKALAGGRMVEAAPSGDLLRYAATHADTVVVGCSTVEEVRANLAVTDDFISMTEAEQGGLEKRIASRATIYDYFKG